MHLHVLNWWPGQGFTAFAWRQKAAKMVKKRHKRPVGLWLYKGLLILALPCTSNG
jgi:hypothetical protein